MNNEIEQMQKAGIDVISEEPTINSELSIRKNTSRRLERAFNGSDDFSGVEIDELYRLKTENQHFISKLQDLKKSLSPFKEIIPKVSEKFEPGAIVYDSWGWDQTNIDFYCVVKVNNTMVTILPMTKEVGPEKGFMTFDTKAGQIDFTQEPIRKKLQNYGTPGFSLRNYAGGGWVSLWNGKPKNATSYA